MDLTLDLVGIWAAIKEAMTARKELRPSQR
jgi:hypothetical protein